jgi:hypothetical protein
MSAVYTHTLLPVCVRLNFLVGRRTIKSDAGRLFFQQQVKRRRAGLYSSSLSTLVLRAPPMFAKGQTLTTVVENPAFIFPAKFQYIADAKKEYQWCFFLHRALRCLFIDIPYSLCLNFSLSRGGGGHG